MARLRFTVGTRYLYNNQAYVISQLLLGDKIVVENQSFGGSVTLTQKELTDLWAREEIRFETHGRYAKNEPNTPLSIEYTIADFQQLLSSRRDEARRRYEIIRPLLDLSPRERTKEHLKEYARKLAPTQSDQSHVIGSPKNLRRKGKHIGQAVGCSSIQMWLEAFIDSGYDIRSLVPETDRHGGKGKMRLDAEVERITKSILEECKSHPKYRTVEDVHLMIVNCIGDENKLLPPNQQLTLPGIATIYRRINAEGKASILRRRASRLEAQADSPVYPGPKPTRILERVEIDDTTLDLIVVDLEDRLPIGRPTLMYAIDAYSGFPCGVYVGFEPPSYHAVQSCLLHCIFPKQDCPKIYGTKHSWPVYGLPETLIVDNGKHYICRHLENSCGQLGINVEEMPIKTPWFKGRIERFFRTNNTGLIHGLPGTTFSNIIERGDYDSQKCACISLDGFMELLHIFLLDKYTQEWHDGIGGGSGGIPAKLWEENLQSGFLPCLHEDARELRFILYPGEYRTIGRGGIDFEVLRYQHSSLNPIRSRLSKNPKRSQGKKDDETKEDLDDNLVHIKYNPADLGTIYVYDDEKHTWLEIPAVDPEYAKGLSIWKHRIIRKYLLERKKEVNIYTLAATKQHMQEVVEREYALTHKSRGRKKGARFLGVEATIASTSSECSPPVTTGGKKNDDIKESNVQENVTDKLGEEVPSADGFTNPPPSEGRKGRKKREKKNNPQNDNNTTNQEAPQEILIEEGWGGDYGLQV